MYCFFHINDSLCIARRRIREDDSSHHTLHFPRPILSRYITWYGLKSLIPVLRAEALRQCLRTDHTSPPLAGRLGVGSQENKSSDHRHPAARRIRCRSTDIQDIENIRPYGPDSLGRDDCGLGLSDSWLSVPSNKKVFRKLGVVN